MTSDDIDLKRAMIEKIAKPSDGNYVNYVIDNIIKAIDVVSEKRWKRNNGFELNLPVPFDRAAEIIMQQLPPGPALFNREELKKQLNKLRNSCKVTFMENMDLKVAVERNEINYCQ